MSSVMVFAPAPQRTVPVEQHNDRPELHVHAGGQGIRQARMITSLGARVTLCATAGGEVGGVLAPLLAEDGITVRTVDGEAGSGRHVHDRRAASRQEIAAGAPNATRHGLGTGHGDAVRVLTDRVEPTPIKAGI